MTDGHRGYVTIDEGMALLGVARRTIFKYLSEGKLRRLYRIADDRTIIPREDIDRLLEPRP